MKVVAVEDIIVNNCFDPPRKSQIDKIRNYYSQYGYIDKPLIVNKRNVLLDGYIRYLVLKENNEKYATVEIINWIPKKRKVDEI